jgi:hypothetical protein
MPVSFTKNESAAEMQDHFTEDEPARGSNEFLIEHELRSKKVQVQRWSLFWTSLAILGIVGIIELIVSAAIFMQLRSLNQSPPLLSELNNLVPNCQ